MISTSSGSQKTNEDIASSSNLVSALVRVRDSGKKSNVRSTEHRVTLSAISNEKNGSAIVQENADDDGEEGKTTRSSNLPSINANLSLHGEQTITLTSWKTQEFAYRKTTKVGLGEDDELPTLARGLFTTTIAGNKHRIVVRGYDKFFNEDEMPWTKKEAIAKFSCPPYELSFKENGCIIFIAALSEHRLIVTSKHSLGANESHVISHAQKGEEWLEKHLVKKGKKKSDLASELWHRNETAVAELCDDQFEEHVLAYPAERTGLHLHGLNKNSAEFETRTMEEVNRFAQEWGFLPTRYLVIDTLAEVERFCQSVGESGSWQGIPIEGFVVRTRKPAIDSDGGKGPISPPYKAGQAWFYKVKFDEPYLMYRDWRELTRRMLSDKQKFDKAKAERGLGAQGSLSSVSDTILHSSEPSAADQSKNAKKKEQKKAEQARRAEEAAAGLRPPLPPQTRSTRPETRLFVRWCYEKLYGSNDGRQKPDLDLFETFNQNKGIIHLREKFIEYMNSSEGKACLSEFVKKPKASVGDIKNQFDSTHVNGERPFDKTLVVPIAVPGCGKTALAVALSELIPDLGHTQSDNVQTKKTAPTFLRNIGQELSKHDVVFADRNNHLFKHRNEIVEMVRSWQKMTANGKHRVRLVALAWSLDTLPLNAIHRICADRIAQRGENHQSLRSTENKEHEKILWQFLRNVEPFKSGEKGGGDQGYGDSAFDNLICMNVNASIEQNLRKLILELTPLLGLSVPEDEEVKIALQKAMEYKVSLRKEVKVTPSIHKVRYYGLAIEADLVDVLHEILVRHPIAQQAFETIKERNRLIRTPHVTLVHSSEVEEDKMSAKRRWETFSQLANRPNPPFFTMIIDLIAWDDRAMALGVSEIQSDDIHDLYTIQGQGWRPHITLGTFSESVRPFEANRVLLEADAGNNQDKVHCVRFQKTIRLQAQIKGLS